MTIRFLVKYSTAYGEAIFIQLTDNSSNSIVKYDLPLVYLNTQYWQLTIDTEEFKLKDRFSYKYSCQLHGTTKEILQNEIEFNAKKIKASSVEIHDEWNNGDSFKNLYNTRPFFKLIPSQKIKEGRKNSVRNSTHYFKVLAPVMAQQFSVCLTGSADKMNNWDKEQPLLLHKTGDHWVIKLNLSKEEFPLEFKVCVYDHESKQIVQYESGDNRRIQTYEEHEPTQLFNINPDFKRYAWRGAGINVQLSSLKTNRSWGIGDFSDLFLLTDWCKDTGMKLVQLLPVNDTTATHTSKDSYPYSAISAFALHPNFLNVQKLATSFSVKFAPTMLQIVEDLNGLPSLDYVRVTELKQQAIRILYEKEKAYFKNDLDWFEFFEINRSWLQPYAAFCYLRDKYKSAEFRNWESYRAYDDSAIDELTSLENPRYDDIAIHYFTQYHLHQQLKDATDYAHKNGIVLKADLPIGVGRNSVDTWMYPHLFHMDKQAGAPPDGFAVKGQNWSFPTYDWKSMAVDNYAWWRQRMEQLSTYFDAVRIDHVLGFFRIWSIPVNAIDGILGRFIPANPISREAFSNEGMQFNEQRLCAPYITEEILHSNFGDFTTAVREKFFDGYSFKQEYKTQVKLAAYFENNSDEGWIREKLLDLLTEVILLPDAEPNQYHFRIDIFATTSFAHLSEHEKLILDRLYNRYFFNMQNELWKEEGIKKIAALKNASSNMLLCGEDLGMVPEFVPAVLNQLQILSLQVERMPKKNTESFSPPSIAPYDSVITPSTHDMSTLREWWEEDEKTTQIFYNEALGHYGTAPFYLEPWIAKDIINQHLAAPSMWAVFLFQDLLAMEGDLRRENPLDERINIPADPNHVWNYRMHLTLENIIESKEFTFSLSQLIRANGRA